MPSYDEVDVSLDCEDVQSLARDQLGDSGNWIVFRFLDALEALTDSMKEETRLSEEDWLARQRDFVDRLVIQGRIQQQMERHPEIGAALPPMVFVTGQHRSGTTFLHNLLSRHTGFRSPALWELMYPVDPAGGGPDEQERLRTRAAERVNRRYAISPESKAARYLHPDLPDECRILMDRAFRTPVDVTINGAYKFENWLNNASMVEPYRFHGVQLQNILWRIPADRLALKSPTHMSALPALAEVYPTAKIVMLHRNPLETVPSMVNFTQLLKPAQVRYRDVESDGNHLLDYLLDSATRMMAARDRHPALETQILDVRYSDLIAEPVKTVTRIMEFADVPFLPPDEKQITEYAEQNPQYKYGRHEYDADHLHLPVMEIEARFADYRERFSV